MNGLIRIGVAALLLSACGEKKTSSSAVPACIDVSAHVATLAIDEALLGSDDSAAVSDALVELRTKSKFVFGKEIEASCRKAALSDGALRCVARAKGAGKAAECEAAAPLVVTAREAIARKIAGDGPAIAPSPGGTDCTAFADHVLGLSDVKAESQSDVRLALGLGCSNGEYAEAVLACALKATTMAVADACDPTHASLQNIPNIVPQRRPEVAAPSGGPTAPPTPHDHEHPADVP